MAQTRSMFSSHLYLGFHNISYILSLYFFSFFLKKYIVLLYFPVTVKNLNGYLETDTIAGVLV